MYQRSSGVHLAASDLLPERSWMRVVCAALIAAAAGCEAGRPSLEVHAESGVAVPAEADLLRATIDTASTIELELDKNAPAYVFRIEAGERVPESVSIDIALLHLRTEPAAHAQIDTPFPRSGESCVRVFVPKIGADEVARIAACGDEYADPPDTVDDPNDPRDPRDPDDPVDPVDPLDPDGPETPAEMHDPSMFAYAPSNIALEGLEFSGALDVTGDCTFDTSRLDLTGACGTPIKANDQNQDTGPDLAVLAVTSARIRDGSALRITGDRAAVIAVRGELIIERGARLEAGAGGALDGPGVERFDCEFNSRTPAEGDRGGGGGGGGFLGNGGGGGAAGGLANPMVGANGGAGGAGVARLVPLLAGCRGSDAGSASGGGGGGALQLSASGTITVDGEISARGGPGAGGQDEGGGGGGSGGAILIEAQVLMVGATGVISADGGGGGGGATALHPGAAGENGANGGGAGGEGNGNQNYHGGNGGRGGARGSDAASGDSGGAAHTAGGGGGGGSAGRIRINTVEAPRCEPAAVSPEPTCVAACC